MACGVRCTSPAKKEPIRPGSTICWCGGWRSWWVCNPRKNARLKSGRKSDAIDAHKLAELLRADMLSAVYHGETSGLEVQHGARSYTMLTEDTTRVMGRLKAVFRGQAVACAGQKLYGKRHREDYLAQLGTGGLRRRAECLYQELDVLQQLRRQSRRELMVECRKQACGGEVVAVGTVSRSDSRRAADRAGADAAPLPHQTSVLDVLRTGVGEARERRISCGQRAGGTEA
jgi:hypothetical protein